MSVAAKTKKNEKKSNLFVISWQSKGADSSSLDQGQEKTKPQTIKNLRSVAINEINQGWFRSNKERKEVSERNSNPLKKEYNGEK